MWKLNGPRLRTLRESRILSQKELEAASGVTERTIRRLELGQSATHPRTIRRLALALNVRPEELVFPGS